MVTGDECELFRANYVVDAFLFAPAADCPAQPFFVRLATARTSRTAAGGQVVDQARPELWV